MSMTETETELRVLMTAAQKGDAAAYRSLLERLSRLLARYFRGKLARMGRSGVDTEDLVQEALIAIHSRRHTYDPDEPFTPWVHAIARYKLIDYLRRTKGAMTEIPFEAAGGLPAKDHAGAAEGGLDVDTLLAKLPARSRRLIEDMKLYGLTVAEAAKRHGMSQSAVKVAVHRGLKALGLAIKRGK